MPTEKAKLLMEQLGQKPFPAEEMPVLAELASLYGTRDTALLCAVCFMYGRAVNAGEIH